MTLPPSNNIAQAAWTQNRKGLYCGKCPEKDAPCLLSGMYHPDARITFLLPSPDLASVERGAPLHDRDSVVFVQLIKEFVAKFNLPFQYNVTYVVGAALDKAPKKEVSEACFNYVSHKLIVARRAYEARHGSSDFHILIPMGKPALESLDISARKITAARGGTYDVEIGEYTWKAMPTLGVSHLAAKPGLMRQVQTDLYRALVSAINQEQKKIVTSDDLSANYVLPQTIEEVAAVCDEIIAYTDASKIADPDLWPISVDTETNTLQPHREDAKVLMVSFAWDDGRATAIALDHEDSPYDAAEALTHVKRVLACPKPKIFHNAKFDYQMLDLCYGNKHEVVTNNIWWDTLLGEHFIDEAKTGFNSLKTIVDIYAPSYSGYEGKLHESLRSRSASADVELLPDYISSGLWRLPSGEAPRLIDFFPSLQYTPISGSEDFWTKLSDEERLEILELEKTYLMAALHSGDSAQAKAKSSARNRIRSRAKKWGIEPPDTVRAYDFSNDNLGYANVPFHVLLVYAAADADVTRIICKKQQSIMAQRQIAPHGRSLMAGIYVPGTYALGKMEYRGTAIDRDLLHTYAQELSEVEARAREAIISLVCQSDFNPNSGAELTAAVRKKFSFDERDLSYNDDKSISTQESILRQWVKTYKGSREGEFAEYLLIYRKAAKARSSFVDKLLELSAYDGRIHTQFVLNGTATGRLASRSMNLQNIPKWVCKFLTLDAEGNLVAPGWNVKRAFVPSDPDHVFWQMDISAAEVRVLCVYAKDPQLIRALIDGLDIHSFITSHVFDIPYEHIEANRSNPDIDHKRSACKRVVFGTLYGAGIYKIAEQIYGALSHDQEEKEAQVAFAKNTMDLLFTRFPLIGAYIKRTKLEVARNKQVQTIFGRYRRFPLAAASGKFRAQAEREAVNFKIQSTASDIVVSQLCEISDHIHEIGGEIQITVHDSICGEIHKDRVPEMQAFFDRYILDRVAEKFEWLPVPFKYDLEIGPNYGDLTSYNNLFKDPADVAEKDMKILRSAGLLP